MKLSIGISPCPNDTFIFDALLHGSIKVDNITFEPYLEDVQTLNEWALAGKLDITKISYGVWPLLQSNYHLLQSGGALGKGVGPLLITRPTLFQNNWDSIVAPSIALPGKNTTAHFLFNFAHKRNVEKVFMPFHTIENAVLNGQVDAGVIIHENRFTYKDKGLVLIKDLGQYWESATGLPIPLGGIVTKQSLQPALIQIIDTAIANSIRHAWQYHYPQLSNFVQQHAQEMNAAIMKQHIDLYVNDYSIQLGETGNKAIAMLLEQTKQMD